MLFEPYLESSLYVKSPSCTLSWEGISLLRCSFNEFLMLYLSCSQRVLSSTPPWIAPTICGPELLHFWTESKHAPIMLTLLVRHFVLIVSSFLEQCLFNCICQCRLIPDLSWLRARAAQHLPLATPCNIFKTVRKASKSSQTCSLSSALLAIFVCWDSIILHSKKKVFLHLLVVAVPDR